MKSKDALRALLYIADKKINVYSVLDKTVYTRAELFQIVSGDLELYEMIINLAATNRFFKGCLMRMVKEDPKLKEKIKNAISEQSERNSEK